VKDVMHRKRRGALSKKNENEERRDRERNALRRERKRIRK
jgi:hypothetical protein